MLPGGRPSPAKFAEQEAWGIARLGSKAAEEGNHGTESGGKNGDHVWRPGFVPRTKTTAATAGRPAASLSFYSQGNGDSEKLHALPKAMEGSLFQAHKAV